MSLLNDMRNAGSKSTIAKVLLVASLVIGMIPVVGVPVSYALERRRNRVIEKKQKEVLVDFYRPQIAAALRIDPRSVTVGDLEAAQRINPMIGGAVQKVETQKKNANRASGFASAGAAVFGVIPGVGGVTNAIAVGAAHLSGSFVGSAVSAAFDKDMLFVHDMVERIDAKREAGEPITAEDIMYLRISQDENWQKQFKEQHKKPFHKLADAEKQQVLVGMPDLLMGADKQAEALNRGLISPQNLVMAGPGSTSNFSGAMAVPAAAAPQSHVARYQAERAAGVGQGRPF